MFRIVIYSLVYIIVFIYECFNNCSYCNFCLDFGKSFWLSLLEVEK